MLEEQKRSKKQTLILVFSMIILLLVIYAPTFQADFIWDDDAYVSGNQNLKTWAGLKRIWFEPKTSPQYYPMVFTTFWIEYRIFGNSPGINHGVNVLLHLLNALLLWIILRKFGIKWAWMIATVFLLHPVHLESVAWITERKNVLSALFYLLSLFYYFRAFPLNLKSQDSSHVKKKVFYSLSLLFFLGALLSKSVTASLPAVILLLIWWKKDTFYWRDIFPVIPMMIMGLGMALMTVWMELFHVGAMGEEWVLTPVQRLIIAGRSLWFYTQKILWPSHLVFIYPKWDLGGHHTILLLYPLSVLLVFFGLWFYKKKIGKAPLVAVMFFAGTLLPALGFFNVYPMRYSYVADHFQYLASIGIISLSISLLFYFLNRIKRHQIILRAVIIVFILLALTAIGRKETQKYMNLHSLWSDTLSKNPQCWMALNNMGNLEIENKNYIEARNYFRKTLKIKPDLAVVYNNIGTSWLKEGQIEKATENFIKTLSLDENHAEAHNNLGVCLMRKKKIDDAIFHYQKAILIKPEYVTAHHNLGNALNQKGLHNQAIKHYQEAIRIKPDLPMSHFQLGTTFYYLNDINRSLFHLQTSLRLKPDFPRTHYQLALLYLKKKDLHQAEKYFLASLQLDPKFTEAMNNLGIIYTRQNKTDVAISYFKKAIDLHPEYAMAHNNLGIAYEKKGNLSEAKLHFTEALRISPKYTTAEKNLLRINNKLNH